MTKLQKKQAYSVWIVDNLEIVDRCIASLNNNLAHNDFRIAKCEALRIVALLENVLRTQQQIREL